MKTYLQQLFAHQPLSRAQAKAALLGITKGAYPNVQVASFVTVYQMRSITQPELQGFRDALLEVAVPFDVEGRETIDIVGTGGDGKDTFNISTCSAVVVAGAGYAVTKHGSYGVSSSVGSSDVLTALGYQFTNDSDALRRQLDRANLCFLHAPVFHPAMKVVVPVRRQLGVKTFFNLLGPLINPARPSHQLFGTFSQELARLYHYILQQEERTYRVVYALDGYDEVSLTGAARVYDATTERLLRAHDFDLPRLAPDTLYGGGTLEAAKRIFLSILKNTSTPAQKAVVCANAGLAIQTLRPELSLPDAVAQAQESIESGTAFQQFQTILA